MRVRPYFLFFLRQIAPSVTISLDVRPCQAYDSGVERAAREHRIADSVHGPRTVNDVLEKIGNKVSVPLCSTNPARTGFK